MFPKGSGSMYHLQQLIKNICRRYQFTPDRISVRRPLQRKDQLLAVQYKRGLYRSNRRLLLRLAHRLLFWLKQERLELFRTNKIISKVKEAFPIFIRSLLTVLFAGLLIMALTNTKDFQFWINITITVILGWISYKNK